MLERLENLSALYANPHRFMNLAARLHAPLWLTAVGALAFGLFMVSGVPDDYQQGATVRIMFVHVPAAWMALFAYSFIFFASIVAVVLRHPLGYLAARAAAPVGAVFTLVALVTGALWGQPMWGTWWVWDARLTSVLVLLFIYLGYIALWEAIDDYGRAARATSILAVVGFVNVPIVKFSVDWWNTLHQPASLLRSGGPAVDPTMLTPLVLMLIAAHAYFAIIVIYRMRALLGERRLTAMLLRPGGQA